MTETMTLHRALGELTLIEKKIKKTMHNMQLAGNRKAKEPVNGIYQEDEFNKTARADYQKIRDLIEREIKIKSAITKANIETKVKIGDTEMTIADAIHRKHNEKNSARLIEIMSGQYRNQTRHIESHNSTIDANALKIAEAALSKDNVKLTDNDVVSVTEPYMKANKMSLVDPLKLESLIKELTEAEDEFQTEVDAVLSEANAITTITF